MGDSTRENRAYARSGMGKGLAAIAAAIGFEGAFAIAVMALDRENRGLSANLGYVIIVESLVAAAILVGIAAWNFVSRLRLARAMRDPLRRDLPPAPGPVTGAWREFALAQRAASLRELDGKSAEARAEMDAFVASVHAIKTPATALSLMSQRAMADGTPLSAEDCLLEIDELCRVVDRAIGRLRLGDFEAGSRLSRIEAGRAARESLLRHKRLFISRNIGAVVEGEAWVETDPAWLAFILDQLLSNAGKYAASKVGIRVEASAALASIEISDDGPGFDPEDLARAFGKSASGSAGERERPETGPASSGYGLYLASEAARKLGLGLYLASKGGARARLELPLARGPLD